MDASDHFKDPRGLIEHARGHIKNFKREIDSFFASNPYAKVIDIDRNTGHEVHKIRLTKTFPDSPSRIAKDAVSNLRDALDHAVYASALSFGAVQPTNTGFPFAKDFAGVMGELTAKRLSDNPPEIRSLLQSFRPHDGGNRLLWGLNQARNPNTHRFVIPIGAANISQGLNIGEIRFSGDLILGTGPAVSRWDTEKNEIEYLRVSIGATTKYKVDFIFQIFFNDIAALKGEEAIGLLDAMAGEVERVVLAIEAETSRIIAKRANP